MPARLGSLLFDYWRHSAARGTLLERFPVQQMRREQGARPVNHIGTVHTGRQRRTEDATSVGSRKHCGLNANFME